MSTPTGPARDPAEDLLTALYRAEASEIDDQVLVSVAVALPTGSRRPHRLQGRRAGYIAVAALAAAGAVAVGVLQLAGGDPTPTPQASPSPPIAAGGLSLSATLSATRAAGSPGQTCVSTTITITNTSTHSISFDEASLTKAALVDTSGGTSRHVASASVWNCTAGGAVGVPIGALRTPAPTRTLAPGHTLGPLRLYFRLTGPASRPLLLTTPGLSPVAVHS